MSDPTSMPSFPPPEDEHPLRGRALDALIDAGLQPSLDAEGDIAVRVSDQLLFVRCADSVPPLMRVFGQWQLDDDLAVDELTRLRAANVVTSALNLVKVTVHGDRLLVAVDLVVGDGVALSALLTATLDAVLGSVQTWYRTVRELLGLDGDDVGPQGTDDGFGEG
jgi:hypothetical protein